MVLKQEKINVVFIYYLGNQELHVVHQSAPPPVFNKFNSLDRRALSRRHHQQAVGSNPHGGSNSIGLLKLVPHSTTMLNGGSESLPPVSTTNPNNGGAQRSLHPSLSSSTNNVASFNPVRTTMNGQYANSTPQPPLSSNVTAGGTTAVITTGGVSNNKLIKEPERRHSSYDPGSRGGGSHYSTSTVSVNGEGSTSSTNYHSSRNSETGTPSSSSTMSSNRLRLSNNSTSTNYTKNNNNSIGANSTLPKTALSAQRSNPINTNGLPDPFGGSSSITSVARKIQSFNQNQSSSSNHHGSTSLYSSQESLSKNAMGTPVTVPSSTTVNINSKVGGINPTGSNRTNAGTPQFQNLSGAIRGGPPPTGSNRVTSTNYFNQQQQSTSSSVNTSSSSPYVSIMSRSISGNNLHSLDSTSTVPTTNGVHPPNPSGHNPPPGSSTNGGRNHTSGSSSGCSSSSAASQHSNGSGGDTSVMNQTPSPSDSAVGDLESMLREKDTEINYLRETMEQNEQVIFKVRTEMEPCLMIPNRSTLVKLVYLKENEDRSM